MTPSHVYPLRERERERERAGDDDDEERNENQRYERMNAGRVSRAVGVRGVRASASARVARVTVSRRAVLLRSKASDMSDALEKAIEEAKETCEDDPKKADCAVAWDNVEEISAEISHKKSAKKVDPLEDFCDDNPEADECRVYED